MGKKDLLKSTSKKGTKKKASAETTAKATKAQKKKTTQKAAPKKAAGKKAPAKKKTAPKKTVAKKKPTIKSLINKKFDIWQPDMLFTSAPDEEYLSGFSAPEPFGDKTQEEKTAIKKLLFRQYSVEDMMKAAEEAAKRKAEEEAKLKAAEEAKRKAEEEAKLKAAEEAKRKAEEEAKLKAAEEAKRKAEEEAKLKAAEEAKRKAEEEAKLKAAEEAKRKAEEEAKLKAAEEAKRKAEEEAQAQADAEAAPSLAPQMELNDSAKKTIIAMVAVLALIITPILIASFSNAAKYYLEYSKGAVVISKGTFAPMGKHRIAVMPGAMAPEEINDIYCKTDVFPIALNYYLDRADTLASLSGMPDFDGIRKDLETAKSYATTDDDIARVESRFKAIEHAILLYKADVGAGKGTVEGYQFAVDNLNAAVDAGIGDAEATMATAKIAEIEAAKTAAEAAAAEAAAAEAAAAEAAAAAAEAEAAAAAAAAEAEAAEAAEAEEAEEAEEAADEDQVTAVESAEDH